MTYFLNQFLERDDGKAWWVFTLFGGNGAPAASKAYPLTSKNDALAKFLKLYVGSEGREREREKKRENTEPAGAKM